MFKNLNPFALGISGHQSEIIELTLTYGFTGMDLNAVELATRIRLKGMEYARRLIDSAKKSAKIQLGTFPLPLDIEADDASFQKDLKRLPEYAQAAADVGCTRTISVLSPGSDKRPYHENFEFHRQRLQEIAGALKGAGVRLGVGFQAAEFPRKNLAYQFIHDFDALRLLLNMAATPTVGLLLDVWEVFASGGSLATIQDIPGEQIVAVQVAEMPADIQLADLNEKSRLLPDAENGRIQVASVLAALNAKGYNGPVTPKPSRGIFPTRRREAIVKQTGDALDRVWKAAGLKSPERRISSAASDFGNGFGRFHEGRP